MTHETRLGVLMAALAVFGAGCATVEWTEDLFAKQQVEVDTRFDKVEAGVREQGERIDRVEVRVASLDTRLSETRDLVRTALPQAPTAVPARPAPAQMRPTATAPDRAARGRTLIGRMSSLVRQPWLRTAKNSQPSLRTAKNSKAGEVS